MDFSIFIFFIELFFFIISWVRKQQSYELLLWNLLCPKLDDPLDNDIIDDLLHLFLYIYKREMTKKIGKIKWN